MKHRHPVEYLDFTPPFGLKSPHLQMVVGTYYPTGSSPVFTPLLVQLDDGDRLSCEVSTPSSWKPTQKTVVLLHGLAGSTRSPYMVRCTRKFYQAGYQVIGINMRGCGSGKELSSRPYHGGISGDLHQVLKTIKELWPLSPIEMIGFSLGANIALKLAGELGELAKPLIHSTIAVCPPIDLAQCSAILARPENRLYNLYYMRDLEEQARSWTKGQPFSNIYEFDCMVTAPCWGFEGAFDYYHQSSSRFILPQIQHPCRILFAADDPFIDFEASLGLPLPDSVKIYVTKYGGHLGFIASEGKGNYFFWIDQLLLKWVAED